PGAAARQIMMPPTAIRVNSTSASGARAEGLPATLKLLTWPDDLPAPAVARILLNGHGKLFT
ncbi:hypothetical protein, partial [Streptomyces sp. NPDC056255]|uniref:hypothetical protein n=1 Tax=Streptomyces sp. NPDC056255 TaxID=3345764 RepID=UPI0035D7E5F0